MSTLQKEGLSNTRAYNNASDDPIFRTRQSLHAKEDKYDASKYSVHYNTLNEPPEEPRFASVLENKSGSAAKIAKKGSTEKPVAERQTKSSQSHMKFKQAEHQQPDTLSEGTGNKTIRESSELHVTVDFKENKGLLSVYPFITVNG